MQSQCFNSDGNYHKFNFFYFSLLTSRLTYRNNNALHNSP